MTLQEWAIANKVVITRRGHKRLVESDDNSLWGLSDYLVSTCTITLSRRVPFSDAEVQVRSNIRNACVGLNLEELNRLYQSFRDVFSQDCVHEFILEVEVENES